MEHGSASSCLQAPATDPCTGPNESGAHPLVLHLQGASYYQDIFDLPSGVSYASHLRLDGILKTCYKNSKIFTGCLL
jgi:hypothetical protein